MNNNPLFFQINTKCKNHSLTNFLEIISYGVACANEVSITISIINSANWRPVFSSGLNPR